VQHDIRVARRYAQALFSTAKAHSLVQSVEADLQMVCGLLDKDLEFRRYMLTPDTDRTQKVALTEKVFSDRVTALTMQLFRIMLEKRREHELFAIRDEFARIRRDNEGIVHITVTSAAELSAMEKEAIIKKIGALLRKSVESEFHIDPQLLGGVKVAYDSYILDGTARGSLRQLRERLRYDLLKQN